MALDIQLSMLIQNSSELFLVYHKEQMFVKTFAFSTALLSVAVPELFAVVDEPSVFAWGKEHILSETRYAYGAI